MVPTLCCCRCLHTVSLTRHANVSGCVVQVVTPPPTLAQMPARCFVAVQAGGMVGFACHDVTSRNFFGPEGVAVQSRGKGIGRALLERVAEEARQRRLRQLTVSPASRNLEAIRSLHAAGYTVLSKITLTFDTAGPTRGWRDGVELHGLRFRY